MRVWRRLRCILSADALAALVAWLFPHSIPLWIKEVGSR